MKENRNIRRTALIRGRMKRYLFTLIAMILSLTLSAAALADNGKSTGRPGGQQTAQPDGADHSDNGKDKAKGKRNAEMEGINTDKIEEAIASLTDADAQASLTALLEAYESAWDARQTAIASDSKEDLSSLTDAVTVAKQSLDAALEAAGVDTDTIYGVPEEAKDGSGRMNSNRPAMDTTQIAAAIAALEDADENKATLTSLLAAYEEALGAEQNADASLTKEQYKALTDATKAAEQALLEATKAAGVTGGQGRGQFVNGYAYGNAEMNTVQIAAQIAGLSDTNENKVMLQEMLAAYEAALAAEQNADTSTLTEEELVALHDATKAAADALKTAMENAGLDVQLMNQSQESKEYQLSVLPDGDGTVPEPTDGLFGTFLEWLSSLFK